MNHNPKRYDLYDNNFYPCHRVEESINGKFVTYEDYQKLQEQLERAEAALCFYCQDHHWNESEAYAERLRISDDDGVTLKGHYIVGGKRARQYFKEKEKP